MKQDMKADTIVSSTKRNLCLTLMVAACAVVAMLALCSCSMSRTPITTDQFISTTESQGFSIVDATNQFESGAVDSVTIAVKDDLQLEFYDTTSTEQAVSAFQENQKAFEDSSTGNNSHSSINAGNYNTYTQSSDTEYCLVSQTDDTLIYCRCSANNKDTVESIVKELGYL